MNIEGRKILVLGGYGLVGMAVCRELLSRNPKEIQIHSLRAWEADQAVEELAVEANNTVLTTSSGDLFGLLEKGDRQQQIRAQIAALTDDSLAEFLLHRVLAEARPEVVVDCVNTATAIAYRDTFRAAEKLRLEYEGNEVTEDTAAGLLEALYIPRLIRHIQILYRGMMDAKTRVYIKVGTSGTGGMGLNIPYTHSEEKPSRVLLSKSAMGGAHSMLLFLMARTPDAPITKEIKPAAAIAWKKIDYGPIRRKSGPIHLVDARPRPLGSTFSTVDPTAAHEREEVLNTVYIDTGENGIFSLEEFSMLTTSEQMEFVTPEEIAKQIVFEIEGGNTGHDIVNALDNAVMGPTYRAGLMRHWALEKMTDLEQEHGTRSVAFEMLGPPHNTKLLFECHLLREVFGTMSALREADPEDVVRAMNAAVVENPELANEVVCVGIPILLDSGELIRGTKVIVPAEAEEEELTPERLEHWVEGGWVDLRRDSLLNWQQRFHRIEREIQSIAPSDSSSRYLRDRRFWTDNIQPGKVVGWILSVEEAGGRSK